MVIAMLDDDDDDADADADATSCRIVSVSTSRTSHSTKPSCPVTRSVLSPYSRRRFVIANRHLAGNDARSADDEEGAG